MNNLNVQDKWDLRLYCLDQNVVSLSVEIEQVKELKCKKSLYFTVSGDHYIFDRFTRKKVD
jgi:hypothetical protein